ncbi:hypothetical protein J6590_046068 [Homalodisca vitripennis]|nr:hypothetical protein J6590_046068 [Homalodisca vitripennis]
MLKYTKRLTEWLLQDPGKHQGANIDKCWGPDTNSPTVDITMHELSIQYLNPINRLLADWFRSAGPFNSSRSFSCSRSHIFTGRGTTTLVEDSFAGRGYVRGRSPINSHRDAAHRYVRYAMVERMRRCCKFRCHCSVIYRQKERRNAKYLSEGT